MDEGFFKKILAQSLRRCRKDAIAPKPVSKAGIKNAHLSSAWVERIADELRRQYPEKSGYRVFSGGYKGNRPEFRLNEYLFDVTVIKTKTVKSASGRTVLKVPQNTLLHIESEFHSRDSRASIVDFGKLTMSAAKNKLLVLPSGGLIEKWAKAELPKLCHDCSGKFFLAFVPHPSEWAGREEPKVQLLRAN